MAKKLGTVKNIGYDNGGHERRERLEATVECPKCGTQVECWSDTEEWRRRDDGRWGHMSYGGAMGQCCGLLFAAQPDGRFETYVLEEKK